MATATELLPEEFLVAVLHRVGDKTRVVDDFRLAKIFNDAAEKYGGGFKQFAWHPQHRYSKRLSEALQALDDGGSISRDNPATDYFFVTAHTSGAFGSDIFSKLPNEDQRAAEEVAEAIRKAFGG